MLPSLLINYFGQGALILIAAVAAVIAFQAISSGTFSLTVQAMQLGYPPRLAMRHTSSIEREQVYVPAINWTLLAATSRWAPR